MPSNVIQIRDTEGNAKYPITDASLVIGMPVISTDISADNTSNTKTASPKAVADYAVQALTANGKKIWAGTQADYDLLTPDSDTLYFIIPASS